MKKKLIVVVTYLFGIGILVLSGCALNGNKNTDVQVHTIKAVKGTLDDGVTISGKLEALAAANVVPKMAGKVARIPVDIGSKVSTGDLLAALDAPELAAAVAQAEANLQKAGESDLSLLQNQARASLDAAEATYKNAAAVYEREKTLLQEGVASDQDFEKEEKEYFLAKSAYEAAQRHLDITINETVPDTIKVCQAQLEYARVNYANSIINSPISGVVTAKNVNPGEMASPGSPVVTVVNLDKVVVRANVDENQINLLKTGQKVPVHVAAVSDKPFQGEITNISYAADSASKAYPVKIQIDNPRHQLKPGMLAKVKLAGDKSKYILVPRDAVLSSGQGSYVYILKEQKAVRTEVRTGRSDEKNVAIVSGLQGGEDVLTGGIHSLKDGMKVNVTKQ